MKGLSLNGRMAFMRKASCLLTVLFVTAASVFLLIYPVFIQKTQAELENAYDSIEVSGWLFNGQGYNEPVIDGELWQRLADSGYIGEHYTTATVVCHLFEGSVLREKFTERDSDDYVKTVFRQVEANKKPKNRSLQAINLIDANDDLSQQKDMIQWLDGYDETCFSGGERICLLPAEMGYVPGGRIPLRLSRNGKQPKTVCLRVAGIYPVNLSDQMCAIIPLDTYEELMQELEWEFTLNGFQFVVKDNRALPALKEIFTEWKLDGSDEKVKIRAAIDDRILDGTVAPIKSNLAMLEGLYKFFFGVVAAIGFFLCFLLARGRRQEYAVMRLLGESAAQVTLKALLEQFLLSLLGIVLGAGILAAVGQGAPDPVTCAIILVCYTLGAAVAVVLTVRVNVMEILRDKE